MNLATANYVSPFQGIVLWISILALFKHLWPALDDLLVAPIALAVAVFLVWFGKGPYMKIKSNITNSKK